MFYVVCLIYVWMKTYVRWVARLKKIFYVLDIAKA